MWLEWQVRVLRQVHPERIEDARLLLGLLLPEEDVQSVLHFLKTEMNNEMAKQIRNLEIEAIAMSPSFCSCKQQQVVFFESKRLAIPDQPGGTRQPYQIREYLGTNDRGRMRESPSAGKITQLTEMNCDLKLTNYIWCSVLSTVHLIQSMEGSTPKVNFNRVLFNA